MNNDAVVRERFWEIAEIMGHDRKSLEEGVTVVRDVMAPDLPTVATYLCQDDEAVRIARTDLMLKGARQQALDSCLPEELAKVAIFGKFAIPPEAAPLIAKNMPWSVRTISVSNKSLAPNEVWVLGVNHPAISLNIGTLTMGAGSAIEVYSSVVTLTCDNVIRQSSEMLDTTSRNYDIGIFGVTPDQLVLTSLTPYTSYQPSLDQGVVSSDLVAAFKTAGLKLANSAFVTVVGKGAGWRIYDGASSVTYGLTAQAGNTGIDVVQLAMQGTLGGNGASGTAGADGTCKCSGSEPGDNGYPGAAGSDGSAGQLGGTGSKGQPSLTATITINNSLSGSLVVKSVGGDGALGGYGGNGGNGGPGGNGGAGRGCEATCTIGGDGGTGGTAGDGGIGGTGGNGGNAQDVFITVPASCFSQIAGIKAASVSGDAGPGGPAGNPGPGGNAGGAPGSCSNGNPGSQGKSGATGKNGSAGSSGGLAGNIYCNGQPL